MLVVSRVKCIRVKHSLELTTSFLFVLVWRRRRIYFKRRPRVLRKWRRRWILKVKGIRYRIRRGGRRMNLKYGGRWRPLKRIRNIWYIYIGGWQRIYYRGRSWTIRRNRRYIRLPRNSRTFRIRFGRKWTPIKCSGRRYFIRFKGRWWRVRRQLMYSVKYRGQNLLVKKTRRGYKVRYRGRFGKSRKGKAFSAVFSNQFFHLNGTL